jgi:Sulfotransferase domain
MTVAGDSSGVTRPGLIAMWAAPRSRSTAIFRYMLEHGGLIALHEPFCNIADHGSTEVDGHLVSDHAELITTLRGLAETATVFSKDTTDRLYQAVLADRRFLTEVTHTFLIRAPAEIAASCYALQGPRLTLPEIGLEYAYGLREAILEAGGAQPVVVDSADLAADPAATMAAYCTAVGIPFRRAALSWAPGDRVEWRLSARWHVQVSESAGFTQSATSYETTTANNEMLARYSAHHEPFYRALRAHAIAIS